jgi:bilin biosynthesis protein
MIELLNYQDGESRKSAALSLMKIGVNSPSDQATQTAISALETALTKEQETVIQPIIKLALSQIQSSLLRENS